jgi:hypothetical protein
MPTQPVRFSGPNENRNYNFLGQDIGRELQTASKYIPELIDNRRKMKNNEASNAEDFQEMTSAIDRLTSNEQAMESMKIKGGFNSTDEVVSYLRNMGTKAQPKERETSEDYLQRQLDVVKKINAMGADGFQEWLRDVSVGETDPSVIASMTKNGQRVATANDVNRLSKQEKNTTKGLNEAGRRNPGLLKDAGYKNLLEGTAEQEENLKTEQGISKTREIINDPNTVKVISNAMDKYPDSPGRFKNEIQDIFKDDGVTKIAMQEYEKEQIAIKAQKILNNKPSPEDLARSKGLKELEKTQKYFNEELNDLKLKNKAENGKEVPNSDLMTEQDFQMDALKDSISVVKKAYQLVSSGKITNVQDAKTSSLSSLRGGFEQRDRSDMIVLQNKGADFKFGFMDNNEEGAEKFAKQIGGVAKKVEGTKDNVVEIYKNDVLVGVFVDEKWTPASEMTDVRGGLDTAIDKYSNVTLPIDEPEPVVSDTISNIVGTTQKPAIDFSKYEN